MSAIPTHPELNRIALARRLDTAYLVWAILRHDTAQNHLSSHYTKSAVRNLSKSYGLDFTLRHWRRILKQGDGLFWGIGYGMVHIRSFKRVYFALADDNASLTQNSYFVHIQPHKDTKLRRATLYHSWFMNRGEVTLARDTIAALFNLSHDQQREYERVLGSAMVVRSNYCHIDLETYKKNPKDLPAHTYSFVAEKFENNRVYERHELAFQIPNTYNARPFDNGVSPFKRSPRRALQVTRTLCGNTPHSHNKQRYVRHIDLYDASMGKAVFVRTYYNRSKLINRIGHYL